MITPISNNLNSSNTVSAIERPRVPRRMNAADSVSFTGKGGAKAVSGIKDFFGKTFGVVKKGIHNLIHSKAVQTVKNGVVKGFHKTVDVIKNIPKAIGGFFKNIGKKFSKKA